MRSNNSFTYKSYLYMDIEMSLTPANDDRIRKEKRDAVELCGKNRGPHDYIPIEWNMTERHKRVTRLLCRVCMVHVSMKSLIENYPEVNF
jgi:hypothetical protein